MKLTKYLLVFGSIFILNSVILYLTLSFVAWSFDPKIWDSGYRMGLAIMTLINFIISCVMANIFVTGAHLPEEYNN